MSIQILDTLDTNVAISAEAAESGELMNLEDSALDQCSGGFGGGSSTSGFGRLRQSFGSMNFAGPEGSGSMRFGQMEDISSFVQDIFE